MASKRRKRPTRPPDKTAENGAHEKRDPQTGRFLVGHPGGPGRPKGVDFRSLIAQHRGTKLETALVEIFDALVKGAKKGDVQAAKLLFDRLCEKDPLKVDLGESFDSLLRRALCLSEPESVE